MTAPPPPHSEVIYFLQLLLIWLLITPEENLEKLVNRMLDELGLNHCADTIVGSIRYPRGERKRTSELSLSSLCHGSLDEPTSGLI
jgi:ABC-type multidrug transport system ATPase subunit